MAYYGWDKQILIEIENDNLTDCRDSEKRKLSQADTNLPTNDYQNH